MKTLFLALACMVLALSATFAACLDNAGANGPAIKFGLIADIQYCDCETANNRYYGSSLQKLEECVEALNAARVQFTVNLGDLVDRDTPDNLPPVLDRLNRLEGRVYNMPGNHDHGNMPDNSVLYRQLGMQGGYYSFLVGGWCFIILNTSDLLPGSTRPGTPERAEYDELVAKLRAEGRPNAASYNGGIGRGQMAWLERELGRARLDSLNVIVFSHCPFSGPKGLTALNDIETASLLARYNDIVKAAIAGHHHSGYYIETDGIPYITTEGMVEGATNAYGIVTIYPDRIELRGAGRTKSYTVPLNGD